MDYKKYIEETVSKFNGDVEHDEYVLLSLMSKLKISPEDEQAFYFLHKRMCEEIDIMIDEIPSNQEYFNDIDSEYIESIEEILDTIELISFPYPCDEGCFN
jgi:hypothetical protein